MNGEILVERLIAYAQEHLHLPPCDAVYVRNCLLSEFGLHAPYDGEADVSDIAAMDVPDALNKEIAAYALANGIIAEGEEERYCATVLGLLTPMPSVINAEFDRINLTFGENNELWRIIAYGQLNEDDSSCSVGLRQYKIYASLLAKKYGKAQEYYTPAMITVETTDSRGKPTTEQKAAAIGNPEFCSQLEAGSAVLYSTFENAEVGAALALNVDGSGKSYIVIDYKNLRILRAKENQTLEAL